MRSRREDECRVFGADGQGILALSPFTPSLEQYDEQEQDEEAHRDGPDPPRDTALDRDWISGSCSLGKAHFALFRALVQAAGDDDACQPWAPG